MIDVAITSKLTCLREVQHPAAIDLFKSTAVRQHRFSNDFTTGNVQGSSEVSVPALERVLATLTVFARLRDDQ